MPNPAYRAEVERFLLYLAAERGLSANYRESARRSLVAFVDWCDERVEALASVTAEHLAEYRRRLRSRGLMDSSIRVATVHLRIFFRYLHRRRGLPSNPAALLESGRMVRDIPETLSADAVNRVWS